MKFATIHKSSVASNNAFLYHCANCALCTVGCKWFCFHFLILNEDVKCAAFYLFHTRTNSRSKNLIWSEVYCRLQALPSVHKAVITYVVNPDTRLKRLNGGWVEEEEEEEDRASSEFSPISASRHFRGSAAHWHSPPRIETLLTINSAHAHWEPVKMAGRLKHPNSLSWSSSPACANTNS